MMTQNKETLREAVARIIAAELGDDFDAAFADKAAWINARGQSGGRFRDVNEPFQGDYLEAADAAIATMFERLRTPSEGMIEAGDAEEFAMNVETVMSGERWGRIWQAMLTAFQQENSECPSCGGLNISCPDGCGRDPITGELDFSRLENSDGR